MRAFSGAVSTGGLDVEPPSWVPHYSEALVRWEASPTAVNIIHSWMMKNTNDPEGGPECKQ